MRAEILIPTAARMARGAPALYTYRVPASLAADLAPGQLVAAPFGERVVAGIVWALDASEDITSLPPHATASAGSSDPSAPVLRHFSAEARLQPIPFRAIAGILLPEPVLPPTQRALAEWTAEHYAAPLGAAVRPMLPPGLLRGVRYVLRPTPPPSGPSGPVAVPRPFTAGSGPPVPRPFTATGDRMGDTAGGDPSPTLPSDAAIVLALLRERGELERDAVAQTLGTARARAAIRALLAAGQISLGADVAPIHAAARRERLVRLAVAPAALDAWCAEARRTLDALPRPATARARGIAARTGKEAGERRAERLLRQLAVLDVLARPAPANGAAAGSTAAWRVEELRRLTRATSDALAELAAAGLIAIEEAEVRHDPLGGRAPARTAPLPLSPAQAAALAIILGDRRGEPAGTPSGVFLLHGITGSGKTEVYLQALAATLAEGRRGIVLVPEIALTPQAVARFAGRFPGRVALLHSGLTDAERLGEWRRIREGRADVVVGSRSALFAPVERLGLIVVDEEHEASYKEERTPSYHARDVAARLGALTGARVVLGSATPSAEAYWRATHGEYALIELRERAPVVASAQARATTVDPEDGVGSSGGRMAPDGDEAVGASGGRPTARPSPQSRQVEAGATRRASTDAADADGPPSRSGVGARLVAPDGPGAGPPSLPPVAIIDLRAELRAGNTSILSETLHAALAETLARGEQAILFLNRRGTASSVMCRECGHVARCVRCDVSLTFHADERVLLCHYCGRREGVPASCPVCWSASIRYFGIGTERVEASVKRQFPAARVLRWDRDTARTRHAHEELLRAFAERRADVLVGTQMIAKGLDLPGVTLVGVVFADIALFLPDFRASERAFQLLTQVAGRAGRGELPGRVLVQTFNPDHFCIQAAARHDYAAFVAAELSARERYGYPPFRRFVKCTYEHADRYTAQIEATVLAERLERLIAEQRLPDADLVGPAPALLERLRGRYRWQLIVRAPDPLPLLRALAPDDLPPGWSVDLDPLNTA